MSFFKDFKKIKVIFSDVDGTLTDGRLYYDLSGEVMKVFHSHDGHGIKLWQSAGKKFGIITSRDSSYIEVRALELQVDAWAVGISKKLEWIERWLNENQLGFENLAYIGDDTNDLEVLKKAHVSASPRNAVAEVKKNSDFHCKRSGGEGAVREFIDYLLLKF